MRLVVQRVKRARVGKSEIGKGLLILLGVKKEDTKKEAEKLVEKVVKLRIMSDENGKMNLNVGNVGAGVLVISQFTLHADTSSGNRPSFIKAEEPIKARKIYDYFTEKLGEKCLSVKTGTFGKYMEIEAVLDGPVTIIYSD